MMIFEQTSTRLPMDRGLYGEIESAIVESEFWVANNTESEFRSSKVYGGQFMQTDAARALQLALDFFFRHKRMKVRVFVISLDSEDLSDKTNNYQTNDRPNRFVVAADAGLTGKRDHLMITLSAIESSPDFDAGNISPSTLARDIATTIRHELVHSAQYDRISKSMGITRGAAKQKMEDWGLIPDVGESRDKYLGSHIELDAFGHEFAEKLAVAFGVEKSLELLSTYGDGQLQNLAKQVDFGYNFNEFFSDHSDAAFTRTLLKKIKKYLLRFQHHNIYEKLIRELKDRQMKITKKRLRKLIREVTDYTTGEELTRTDEMQPPGINKDFAAEPPKDASFAAWKFRIETDVLSDDMIAAEESDIQRWYRAWREGALSWDEVIDYVLELAY